MNSPSFDQFSQIIADVMIAVRNSKATELTSEEIDIMRFIVNGVVPEGLTYCNGASGSDPWGLYDSEYNMIWAAPSGFVPAPTPNDDDDLTPNAQSSDNNGES